MSFFTQTATSSFTKLLDDKFSANAPNEDLSILRALKALHAGQNKRHVALLDSTTCPSFPLSAYLQAREVKVDIMPEPLHELVQWDASVGAGSAAGLELAMFGSSSGARTDKGELNLRLITGATKFSYEGTDFLVYKVSWRPLFGQQTSLFDFVFDDAPSATPAAQNAAEAKLNTVGHTLVRDVYRWAGALKDEMWVFQDGVWSKDKALWGAIRDASWNEIILEKEFLEGLRRDTRTFFDNRKIYKDLGVIWKRGLLLLGPPGNGKTESIKVLLKESGQAALYVKSFTTQDGAELGVRRIFDHARANAPCILVIEDLDSLVTSEVRSFFLNELDGIGQNEGILTIATTNHPERIDDAILNRPSRFDVKYNFALPTEELRNVYALKWIRKIAALSTDEVGGGPIVRFEKDDAQLASEVAKETNDWSFAFLKELFVSFLLRVAHDKARALAEGKEAFLPSLSADKILLDQAATLSNQILAVKNKDANEEKEGSGGHKRDAFSAAMAGAMRAARAQSGNAHSGTNF